MGFEPMNTGFADLQGAFALVCPRFVPLVYSMDYRFYSRRIQAHLNRHPLHYPLQCKAPPFVKLDSSEIRSFRKCDFQGVEQALPETCCRDVVSKASGTKPCSVFGRLDHSLAMV
jgi:hypothetical protein